LILKELRQITVVGLGLLGASVTLAVLRTLSAVKTIGYSHRHVTRQKARKLGVAGKIVDQIEQSVAGSDIVILATPICTFEEIFIQIAGACRPGCIVTDVGSTKVLAHRWAQKTLPKNVYYVGSHPIAGSEQRGVDFARDDLFYGADCILTATEKTNPAAIRRLKRFWTSLGCTVKQMSPAEHDRILANVSHLPHIMAAALMNVNNAEELKLAGQGFIDASRIASGPANIWSDILVTNAGNAMKSIDRIIKELIKLRKAVKSKDKAKIEKLLEQAKTKRSALIKYKIKREKSIS